jgi:tetratricopeptide (TPR) repeat protein
MRCFSPEGIALASPDLQASLRQHQAGNLDAAIAGYRAFLQQQPNHAEANRLLGLALFTRGEVTPAREVLERAATLALPNAALLNDLGNARRAVGDKAAAVEAFTAAIKSEPGFAFAHFNLADALLEAAARLMTTSSRAALPGLMVISMSIMGFAACGWAIRKAAWNPSVRHFSLNRAMPVQPPGFPIPCKGSASIATR